MSDQARQTPFETLFRVMAGLEVEDLERFQALLPFLLKAEWVSGSLPQAGDSEIRPGDLGHLVDEVVARLDEGAPEQATRVVAFLLADWGRPEITGIKPALGRLREAFPGARIEAWLMPETKDHHFELILVAAISM
jgi:hypothetical protein